MVLRSFTRGRIGVPAASMAALPAAVAGPQPLIGARTLSLGPGLVVTEGGEIHCRAVMVVTDPVTASACRRSAPGSGLGPVSEA